VDYASNYKSLFNQYKMFQHIKYLISTAQFQKNVKEKYINFYTLDELLNGKFSTNRLSFLYK